MCWLLHEEAPSIRSMFSGRRRCGVPTDKLLELEGLTKYFISPWACWAAENK